MVKFNNILKNRGGAPANSLSACVCRAHALCNAFSDLYLKTPANQKSHFKNPGFTLTEILLAIAIVGLIAALVLPAMVTNYQNRALELGFNRELNALNETVRGLAVTENKLDFFSTIMYSDSEPEGYDETSGKFVKKYLKVSKYCGDNNGDCFAEKYYNYNDSTHKKEVYEPLYKGACASLKNGASICITPQVGGTQIAGFLDINGKKGPNILNRDLRPFTIDINTEKTSLSKTTTEVLSTPETDLKLGGACEENSLSKECCDTRPVAKGDPCCIHYQSKVGHPCYEAPEPPKSACELDPNGLDCCKTKTITSPGDACCNYSQIKLQDGCKYHCTMSFFGGSKIVRADVTGNGSSYCMGFLLRKDRITEVFYANGNNHNYNPSNTEAFCIVVNGTYGPCHENTYGNGSFGFTLNRSFYITGGSTGGGIGGSTGGGIGGGTGGGTGGGSGSKPGIDELQPYDPSAPMLH